MAEEPVGEMYPRESFPFLTDEEWSFLPKLHAVFGSPYMEEFLQATAPDAIRDRIRSFKLYEDSLVASVARQQQPPAPPAAPVPIVVQAPPAPPPQQVPRGPKPLNVKVSVYNGKEGENLLFWTREVELALQAGQIEDPRKQVIFAISQMGGRAKAWALTFETNEPGHFTDWAVLKSGMRTMFLPPNSEFMQRAKFLECKQGSRDLYSYVQELRQLRSSIAADPIPEPVMVTVFMQGLEYSPVKAELFRRDPATLEEAINIALREDHCLRQARGIPVLPAAQGELQRKPTAAPDGPEPMELDALESRKLRIRCYNCQQFGHYQRNCPRLKNQQQGNGNAKGKRPNRWQRRKRQSNDNGTGAPGNANTQ